MNSDHALNGAVSQEIEVEQNISRKPWSCSDLELSD